MIINEQTFENIIKSETTLLLNKERFMDVMNAHITKTMDKLDGRAFNGFMSNIQRLSRSIALDDLILDLYFKDNLSMSAITFVLASAIKDIPIKKVKKGMYACKVNDTIQNECDKRGIKIDGPVKSIQTRLLSRDLDDDFYAIGLIKEHYQSNLIYFADRVKIKKIVLDTYLNHLDNKAKTTETTEETQPVEIDEALQSRLTSLSKNFGKLSVKQMNKTLACFDYEIVDKNTLAHNGNTQTFKNRREMVEAFLSEVNYA